MPSRRPCGVFLRSFAVPPELFFTFHPYPGLCPGLKMFSPFVLCPCSFGTAPLVSEFARACPEMDSFSLNIAKQVFYNVAFNVGRSGADCP